jgi:hypothetical protein
MDDQLEVTKMLNVLGLEDMGDQIGKFSHDCNLI